MICHHGAGRFAGLSVDAYNLKLEENGGFVGDRVRSKAFVAILDDLRSEARRTGADPLHSVASADRPTLDTLLERQGTPAADLIEQAVDAYADAFADVVRRFLAAEPWQGTQRVVVGGGLRESRVGEEAIRRADLLLQAGGHAVALRPIHLHPDEAALIGALHLRPVHLAGPGAILAVDIGGSNVRAGVVLPDRGGEPATVVMREHWRHGQERTDRDGLVDRITSMLASLADRARRDGLALAPFVGLGCPGEIRLDGTIAGGTQNLPGDWQESGFNLPERVRVALPPFGGTEARVILHNDAVLQGLSELSRMREVARWGVLTIGTGLGNARFTTTTTTGRPGEETKPLRPTRGPEIPG